MPRQVRREAPIDLHREDVGASQRERPGQRPKARPDLHDAVVLGDPRTAHDVLGRIRIDEEVLATKPTRSDPGLVEQSTNLVATERRHSGKARHRLEVEHARRVRA